MTDTETRTEYGVRFPDGHESWGCAVGYARQVTAVNPGGAVIQRTITYGPVTVVPDPLPTTPGSVIEATVGGEDGLLVLLGDRDERQWFAIFRTVSFLRYYASSDLSNVVVKYDAGADK